MRRVLFPTFGAGVDVNVWSGVPYFLLRAARATGIPLEPVPVPTPDDLSRIRRWWRVRQLLFHLRPPDGFSYSPECLAAVWDNNERFPDGVEIRHFQLLSPRILDRVEAGRLSLSFYVDITFRELLRQYPRRWTVNPAIATWTEALERRGYHAARRVIVFSSSSARVITEAMAVPASKVHVVTPGANVDEALINDAAPPPAKSASDPFVVGFVGMDWQRKGLLRLVEAITALRRNGVPIALRVVGPRPNALRNMDGVELLGQIDKSHDKARWIEVLRGCDLGALLSVSEGVPISFLEFQRMGVPIIGTNVNGIPDIVTNGAGILVQKNIARAELIRILGGLAERDASYVSMRKAAWERRRLVSWAHTMPRFEAAIGLADLSATARHH